MIKQQTHNRKLNQEGSCGRARWAVNRNPSVEESYLNCLLLLHVIPMRESDGNGTAKVQSCDRRHGSNPVAKQLHNSPTHLRFHVAY